jgi:hypothetical protein
MYFGCLFMGANQKNNLINAIASNNKHRLMPIFVDLTPLKSALTLLSLHKT